jgi:hypothetical protein
VSVDDTLDAITKMCVGIATGIRPSTVAESHPGDRAAHDQSREAIDDLLSMATAVAPRRS